MLYHTIAMTVVAIEVYFITEIVKMKNHERVMINATITIGYLTSLIFGFIFGYFGHNYAFHGLFLVGQSLVFFSGILLCSPLALEGGIPAPRDSEKSKTKKGLDLDGLPFYDGGMHAGFGDFGAVSGSYWSNGHETSWPKSDPHTR